MKQLIAIFLFIFALSSCNTKATCDCAECCVKCKTECVTDSTAVTPETDAVAPAESEVQDEPAAEETK